MISADQPAFSEVHIHHFMTDAEGKQQPAVVPRWGGGLTKREYFAAMAMEGLIPLASFGGLEPTTNQTIAIRAIGIADALIAELNRKEPQNG